MKRILFMGMPGAGKGTQAELLKKKKIYHISTGDVIRKSRKKEIVYYRNHGYANGDLLSDELIFEIIQNQINKLPKDAKGYILDGAVRTLEQAKYVKEKGMVDEVIFYRLRRKTATKRLLARHEGRTDDNPKAIKHRFEEYKKKTRPVLKFLKKNFKFHRISSEPSVEEIFEATKKALKLK
jgi:adenylate kinase